VKNKQKEIINNVLKKAGSYRKLSKTLDIPRSSINTYCNGRVILEERFIKIIHFLNIGKKN